MKPTPGGPRSLNEPGAATRSVNEGPVCRVENEDAEAAKPSRSRSRSLSMASFLARESALGGA